MENGLPLLGGEGRGEGEGFFQLDTSREGQFRQGRAGAGIES